MYGISCISLSPTQKYPAVDAARLMGVYSSAHPRG